MQYSLAWFGVQWCVGILKEWLHTAKKGHISLVSLPALGVEHGVRALSWDFWDDVDLQVGRLVRIAGDEVVYSLPMDSLC